VQYGWYDLVLAKKNFLEMVNCNKVCMYVCMYLCHQEDGIVAMTAWRSGHPICPRTGFESHQDVRFGGNIIMLFCIMTQCELFVRFLVINKGIGPYNK
jgi:hypothetical protein